MGAVGRSHVALAGDIIINLFAHVKGNSIIYFIYVHNRCIKRLITLIDCTIRARDKGGGRVRGKEYEGHSARRAARGSADGAVDDVCDR